MDSDRVHLSLGQYYSSRPDSDPLSSRLMSRPGNSPTGPPKAGAGSNPLAAWGLNPNILFTCKSGSLTSISNTAMPYMSSDPISHDDSGGTTQRTGPQSTLSDQFATGEPSPKRHRTIHPGDPRAKLSLAHGNFDPFATESYAKHTVAPQYFQQQSDCHASQSPTTAGDYHEGLASPQSVPQVSGTKTDGPFNAGCQVQTAADRHFWPGQASSHQSPAGGTFFRVSSGSTAVPSGNTCQRRGLFAAPNDGKMYLSHLLQKCIESNNSEESVRLRSSLFSYCDARSLATLEATAYGISHHGLTKAGWNSVLDDSSALSEYATAMLFDYKSGRWGQWAKMFRDNNEKPSSSSVSKLFAAHRKAALSRVWQKEQLEASKMYKKLAYARTQQGPVSQSKRCLDSGRHVRLMMRMSAKSQYGEKYSGNVADSGFAKLGEIAEKKSIEYKGCAMKCRESAIILSRKIL